MSWQFHKRQERDLLDQKKEKEENLLLEMVSLKLIIWRLNPVPLFITSPLSSATAGAPAE